MQNKFINLNGANMHYLETGEGLPILFLHGMPTSSYIWRHIMPHLASLGHCIAPDLMGMGLSDQPDIQYSIFDHIQYIDSFIQKLNLKNILLVMHGWGSIIGFNYAMRHESNCRGLVFYEAFLRDMDHDTISLPYQEQLLDFANPNNLLEIGNNAVSFVDKILPQYSMQELSVEDMENYRTPFMQPNSSQIILQYIKELPRGDCKGKVDELIATYSEKLTHSMLPKLMLYSIPGLITSMATVMWAKEHLSNLELADIGEELHFAQETSPDIMGETISAWLQAVEQGV